MRPAGINRGGSEGVFQAGSLVEHIESEIDLLPKSELSDEEIRKKLDQYNIPAPSLPAKILALGECDFENEKVLHLAFEGGVNVIFMPAQFYVKPGIINYKRYRLYLSNDHRWGAFAVIAPNRRKWLPLFNTLTTSFS